VAALTVENNLFFTEHSKVGPEKRKENDQPHFRLIAKLKGLTIQTTTETEKKYVIRRYNSHENEDIS
jgi:hypothetical protein